MNKTDYNKTPTHKKKKKRTWDTTKAKSGQQNGGNWKCRDSKLAQWKTGKMMTKNGKKKKSHSPYSTQEKTKLD